MKYLANHQKLLEQNVLCTVRTIFVLYITTANFESSKDGKVIGRQLNTHVMSSSQNKDYPGK